MKTLKIIILLILVITVSNCSKSDDDNSQVPPVESIRLKSYTKEGVNFELTYNENNQLSKFQYGVSSPISQTLQYDAQGNILKIGGYNYAYNAQGNMTSISSSILNADMTYNSQGLLTAMNSHYTYTTTDIAAVTNYEYDSNNRIITVLEYSDDVAVSPYAKTTLVYNTDGNVVEQRIERSNDGTDYYPFLTIAYTYDTKNNPYYNVINHAGLENHFTFHFFYDFGTVSFGGRIGGNYINFFSPNNLISEESSLSTTGYNYTYNEDDYPITLTKTTEPVGGSAYSYNLTFTYETY